MIIRTCLAERFGSRGTSSSQQIGQERMGLHRWPRLQRTEQAMEDTALRTDRRTARAPTRPTTGSVQEELGAQPLHLVQ